MRVLLLVLPVALVVGLWLWARDPAERASRQTHELEDAPRESVACGCEAGDDDDDDDDDEPEFDPVHVLVVASSGGPVENAIVEFGTDVGGSIDWVRSEDNGRATIDMEVPGWIRVRHRDAAKDVRVDHFDPANRELTVTLEFGLEIRGMVVFPKGRYAHVGLTAELVKRADEPWHRRHAFPDGSGRFVFKGLRRARYRVSLMRGQTFSAPPIEVEAPANDVRIPLARSVRAEILVLDAETGKRVTVPVLIQRDGTAAFYGRARDFVRMNLWPGRDRELLVSALGYRPHRHELELGDEPYPRIEVKLAPGPVSTLDIRCLDADGRPLKRVHVKRALPGLRATEKHKLEDGRTRMRLPPGRHQLVLDVPGFRWAEDKDALAPVGFTVDLNAGETKSLDVRLPRAGWVKLELPADANGEPRFTRDGVAHPFGAPATGEKRAWSGCLAPGDYDVEVPVDDGVATGRVTVVAGEERAFRLRVRQ